MNVNKFKNFLRQNINGFYYSIISNILRSTVFPYVANKKELFKLMKIFLIPEVTIDTIGLCNARCKFCSYRISDRPKEIIQLEKFKKLGSQVKKSWFHYIKF